MNITNINYCFPNGKNKALTLSYDDGRKADRRLVDIFDKNGLRSTFHLNSSRLSTGDYVGADEVKTLYANHEVAAHTVSHPSMLISPSHIIASEVLEDRKALEKLVNYPVTGFSYPFGWYNDNVISILKNLGIKYARSTITTNKFEMPKNLYEWEGTCHHKNNLLKLADEFISIKRTHTLYLMYVWGHSYEFDNDNNWNIIEEFAEKISGKEDIWYATNIEIVNYMEAVESLIVSADGSFAQNLSAIDVFVRVDGEIKTIKSGEITLLK